MIRVQRYLHQQNAGFPIWLGVSASPELHRSGSGLQWLWVNGREVEKGMLMGAEAGEERCGFFQSPTVSIISHTEHCDRESYFACQTPVL